MPASNIISNPAFYNIQAPSSGSAKTKSVILYANKFSGLPEQKMNDDLLALFSNPGFSLTDINLRAQLQHILDQYDGDNGPWYIDGINGTLHIHNRKIAKPTFTYRYQDENGEVLKVQVVTNWTTGSTSGTVASAISPDKNFDSLTYSDIKPDMTAAPKDMDKRLNPGAVWLPMDNVGRNNGTPPPQYDLIGPDGLVTPGGIDKASDMTRMGGTYKRTSSDNTPETIPGMEGANVKKALATKEIMENENNLQNVAQANQKESAYTNKAFSDMASDTDDINAKRLDLLAKDVGQAVNRAQVGEMGNLVEEGYNYICEHGAEAMKDLNPSVQEALRQNLNFNSEKWREVIPRTKGVRDFKVSSNSKSLSKNIGIGEGSYHSVVPKGQVDQNFSSVQEAREWMTSHNYISYNSTRGGTYKTYNKEMDELLGKALETAKGNSNSPNVVGNINLQVDADGNVTWTVRSAGTYAPVMSAVAFANYIYQRNKPGTGGSKMAQIQAYLNSMANRGKKAKHKEIEVQMIVVGRPLLKSGQYLYIGNIGKKYSGSWYIKTCIHQMDSNGYTCSLTLKKNGSHSGATLAINSSRGNGLSTNNLKPFKWVDNNGVEQWLYLNPIDMNYLKDKAAAGGDIEGDLVAIMAMKEGGDYGPNQGLRSYQNTRTIQLDAANDNPNDAKGVSFPASDKGQEYLKKVADDNTKLVNQKIDDGKNLSKAFQSKKK